ncbi:toxin-antitoxin system HicB family antitoxin [candidate division KSB3 bacterium]|uniref:Toxin-antitoxin system HicB family antitoxin n=1 Tax=candidate division KSB3 bacterium TaxID=2044937 RepID=A0A2G6KDN8_9BACT|nr:MAG: toxin-antitoxin system HicB family antitoxin [candidate division KSB3 bacterium]
MSMVSIHLPRSLQDKAGELAHQDGISFDQFVVSAVAEKLSVLLTADYLEKRAARSSQEAFEHALQDIPDVEPEPYDAL